jgi:DNA-directed RNA polymerase subunit RPC12/RpoP
MEKRFNKGYTTYLFPFIQQDSWVRCPACSQQAFAKPKDPGCTGLMAVLVCPQCGYSKNLSAQPLPMATGKGILQYEKGVILLGESVDPYFHQPLWLQIPVKNQTLWAYHPAHLHFLKALIGAGLRERNGMDKAN